MLNAVLGLILFITVIVLVIEAIKYVLTGIAMYTIAKRRGLSVPWLAWIPVANIWLLGDIADDARFRKTGKKSRLRIWLLVLMAVSTVFSLVTSLLTTSMTESALSSFDDAYGYGMDGYYGDYEDYFDQYFEDYGYYYDDDYYWDNSSCADSDISALPCRTETAVGKLAMNSSSFGIALIWVLLLGLVGAAVYVVYTVFYYIALYRLYDSCQPGSTVVYLVLSIFFSFLIPLFLFLCRKSDDGILPAWAAPAYPYGQPAYGQGYGQNPCYGQTAQQGYPRNDFNQNASDWQNNTSWQSNPGWQNPSSAEEQPFSGQNGSAQNPSDSASQAGQPNQNSGAQAGQDDFWNTPKEW